ncbi:hypothetical protein [Streptomyces xiaopingdaonensis]|uniref:hypothetical protein n=1 Tax=Streptomyces xiaopingdaonensis TaxID=1565415 RepID=UPI0012FE893D|nr:hypothetical protein [Streptomyces xiaopingdaonensis]
MPAASAADPGAPAGGPELKNWQSSMYDVLTGFQSRRWNDQQYSQIWFTKCRVSGASSGTSTHVDLRWDRTAQPDNSWGVKKYTACFKGSAGKSNGEWHNLAKGKHFFQINKINGAGAGLALSVQKVYIDTTKADG